MTKCMPITVQLEFRGNLVNKSHRQHSAKHKTLVPLKPTTTYFIVGPVLTRPGQKRSFLQVLPTVSRNKIVGMKAFLNTLGQEECAGKVEGFHRHPGASSTDRVIAGEVRVSCTLEMVGGNQRKFCVKSVSRG